MPEHHLSQAPVAFASRDAQTHLEALGDRIEAARSLSPLGGDVAAEAECRELEQQLRTELWTRLLSGSLHAAALVADTPEDVPMPVDTRQLSACEPDWERGVLLRDGRTAFVGVEVSDQPPSPASARFPGEPSADFDEPGNLLPPPDQLGAPGYIQADMPLLDEMWRLVLSGGSPSVRAAAIQLAEKAAGGGTLESRQKRLERHYRQRHGGKRRLRR